MRILHTSDWHVGKTLRGVSRLEEHAAVLGEVARIAADDHVDLVLVAGDCFESAAPPPDAQRVVWDALLALRATGARVAVIGGNHDNQHALDAVAPVFAAAGITVLGHANRPEQGGLLEFTTRAGEDVQLVLLPFVSQRFAIRSEQMLELDAAAASGMYAERMRRLVCALCAGFRADAVNIVMAHCFVRGGVLGGGERDAQTIFDYSIDANAFPGSANYVALGHLHRTQQMHARTQAWYSGSPIQVDFGEEADAKHVLVVETAPGVPAKVEARPLTTPWQLRTVKGTVDQLRELAPSSGETWLRVVVQEPARAGLADEVRTLLPRAVDVRVESVPASDGDEMPRVHRQGRTPRELFAEYLASEGVDDGRVVRLFEQLYDEATSEAIA
jgi:exonuclease SbcD